MNKESLRKKIKELNEESQIILEDKSLSKEAQFFIKSMLSLIEVIVAVFLLKKTRKNSSNSGLPPSKNNGSNGNRNKSINKDSGKVGSQVPNTRNVTEKLTMVVDTCKLCGEDLSMKKVHDTETRTEIDIIYEIRKKEVTAEIKQCSCGHINKGSFPKGMDGKLQYGMGIKAAIINFLMVQMFSYERCAEHFKGLIGQFISQATMLKYVMNFYLSLESWEEDKKKELLKMPVMYVDETSIRVDKKNHWIHVYSSKDISLQFVHEKRGQEAVDDIGLIPHFNGVIVHDCWATYFLYDNVEHALCGSHILRELRYTIETEPDRAGWALMMKDLLQEAGEVVASRTKKRILSTSEYQNFQKRYREILDFAVDELSPFPEKRKGKRGRLKHTEAQNLFLRLKKYESSILMFARVKEVDFTNNRAERDIRSSKTKQKVSGGFRTLKFAKAYARITSYVKSKRYEGYSSFEAINLKLAQC